MCPCEIFQLGEYPGTIHALKAYRGYKGQVRSAAAQDPGNIAGAATEHELLCIRVQIFLVPGQVIYTDDHIHTGRTKDKN